MKKNFSFSNEDVILTDICSKSNKKITYLKVKDTLDIVGIKVNGISTWDFSQRLNSLIKDIFLPKGYPASVSSDYLEYQIWDTCQAFCSSISGTLTMQAVMQGIGVGSNAATPISAAVTWIMKDGTGMIGSILFAWLKGSKLDSDCKKWRLFADILNDIAMFIELYIPMVINYSMYMLCIATVFKALVGTAGSSTRAALITHQAIRGNIADVSAKDGSQEIFTNLFAFVFGIFLLKNVTETEQIWTVMCTATFFHLYFNYKAVRCLKMNFFNSERFRLNLRIYLPTAIIPTVEQINKKESVFLIQGTSDKQLCGFSILFGASLKKAIKSQKMTAYQLNTLAVLFQDKNYFILAHNRKKKLYVTFRQNYYESDVLKAYFHAVLLGIAINYLEKKAKLRIIERIRKNSPLLRLKSILQEFLAVVPGNSANSQESENILKAYMSCDDFVDKEFIIFSKACKSEGWSIDKHLINVEEWRADWKLNKDKKEYNVKRNARTIPKYKTSYDSIKKFPDITTTFITPPLEFERLTLEDGVYPKY